MTTEKSLKEEEYLEYINEHISNVKLAFNKYANELCRALNVSPTLLAINVSKHDESKYSEDEFDGYRQFFYPCSDEEKDQTKFDIAWEHHYKNNPHHEDYYIGEFGKIKDMDPIYIAEMLLDWEAMSIKFNGNTYEYYKKNRDKKPFSENTKLILDKVVEEIFKN